MSIYENISLFQLMKRPFRVFSNAYHSFISGPKTGKPFKIKFESSTICNLKCIMCPLTEGLSRKTGFLKFENFKKVYDEIKVPYLNLTGLGEPLLNPDIFRMISYARKKGSLVKLDTNATLLDMGNIKKLIEADPSFISISIDSITKKNYEKIRKGARFEEVIENLKNLIEYRNKVGSRTQVHLFFVLQKDNIKELIDFIKFGEKIGVDVINGTIAISFGKINNTENIKINLEDIKDTKEKLEILEKKAGIPLNLENIKDFLENPHNQCGRMAKKPCFYPWYNPCVTWDGYVVPCDLYCDNEIVFGNAFKEPFMKIWNNKKAQEFRKQLIKKRKGVCERCCVDESFIFNKLRFFYKTPMKNLSHRKSK